MKQIFADQLGNTLTFENIPSRIVSLVPSQTELLFDLGLEDKIVGITKFCIHPKHLKQQKTIIGGTKNVNFNKIKNLNPDIIIANKEENTQEIVTELQKIAPVWVSDIFTIDDTLNMIDVLGKIFNLEQKAISLNNNILSAYQNFKKQLVDRPKISVAYLIWKNPYIAVGNNNFINTILEINNLQNIFEDKNRYPECSLEELMERKPDFIFLSSEPYPFKEKDFKEFLSINPNIKIILVDGEMFSWYGSRLLHAFDYFAKLQQSFY